MIRCTSRRRLHQSSVLSSLKFALQILHNIPWSKHFQVPKDRRRCLPLIYTLPMNSPITHHHPRTNRILDLQQRIMSQSPTLPIPDLSSHINLTKPHNPTSIQPRRALQIRSPKRRGRREMFLSALHRTHWVVGIPCHAYKSTGQIGGPADCEDGSVGPCHAAGVARARGTDAGAGDGFCGVGGEVRDLLHGVGAVPFFVKAEGDVFWCPGGGALGSCCWGGAGGFGRDVE